ncbi:hypothetical protein RRG08_011849 [Elysia crispata]|uniref:Uncharacterized protein n=1 Tax=Elysia crispata TaxID=231223 RepID=A0AAE0ZN53_9GAST|nr:hypothetical protein RRG08_011849 [Elysia crispata]
MNILEVRSIVESDHLSALTIDAITGPKTRHGLLSSVSDLASLAKRVLDVDGCELITLMRIARSQEPGVRSQEPGARSQEPGTREQSSDLWSLISTGVVRLSLSTSHRFGSRFSLARPASALRFISGEQSI